MARTPKSGRAKALAKKAPAIAKASAAKRLSRLGKKRRPGSAQTAGASSSFVSRSVALRRLQLTLKDFRRLCILKGIYPRDVSKVKHLKQSSAEASTGTYYHAKDISALAREPLVGKFREFKTFMRRVRHLVGRREVDAARRKHDKAPTYTLHHLVKERYPKFRDALEDLDDALSLAYLFASLPAEGRVEAPRIAACEDLRDRWERYVATTRALRKAFVSIKGVYFEARVRGVDVRWLVPHQFARDAPDKRAVDYRVMLTFLEFADILLKFVLFKLYRDDADLFQVTTTTTTATATPPSTDHPDHAAGATTTPTEEEEEEEEEDSGRPKKKITEARPRANNDGAAGSVFRGLAFRCSREARYSWLDFLVRSGGGRVLDDDDELATHVVTDRDTAATDGGASPSSGVERVQPQWVADSFNNRRLLPVARYAPGADLPPHLSPFVDDDDYKPAYRDELDAAAPSTAYAAFRDATQQRAETPSADDDKMTTTTTTTPRGEDVVVVVEGATGDGAAVAAADGTDDGDGAGKSRARPLATIMMSKKAKRLHGRMLHGIQRKRDAVDRLKKRRAKLDAAAAAASQGKEGGLGDGSGPSVPAAAKAPLSSAPEPPRASSSPSAPQPKKKKSKV